MASAYGPALGAHRRRTLAIWLTISLTFCIAVLTLIPIDTPKIVAGNDKIHHLVAFAALTFPCAVFYPKGLFRVAIVAAFYGGLIEVVQPFVGRSGELADFWADLAGIALGATVGVLLHAGGRRWNWGRPSRNP